MNLLKEINEIELIEIGYDTNVAILKFNKILKVIRYLSITINTENKKISDDLIEHILQISLGIFYEIGSTRQPIEIQKNEMKIKLIEIARKIFLKNKKILPYLYLGLNNSLENKILYSEFENEILLIMDS